MFFGTTIMIQKQMKRSAAVATGASTIPRRMAGLRPATFRWLLGLGTSVVLGQSSELSVPGFGNELAIPPTPGTGPGDANATANEARFTAPGADHGILHDIGLTRDLPYIPPLAKPNRTTILNWAMPPCDSRVRWG